MSCFVLILCSVLHCITSWLVNIPTSSSSSFTENTSYQVAVRNSTSTEFYNSKAKRPRSIPASRPTSPTQARSSLLERPWKNREKGSGRSWSREGLWYPGFTFAALELLNRKMFRNAWRKNSNSSKAAIRTPQEQWRRLHADQSMTCHLFGSG